MPEYTSIKITKKKSIPLSSKEDYGSSASHRAAAFDLAASVAFGPWRCGRLWLSSAGGLRFSVLGDSFFVFRVPVGAALRWWWRRLVQ
jgi:hypothetical protein